MDRLFSLPFLLLPLRSLSPWPRQKTFTPTLKPIEVTLWNHSAGIYSTSPGSSSHSVRCGTERRNSGNSASFQLSMSGIREEEPET